MFEKEAEEYTENPKSAWKQGMTCVGSVRQAFKDGAEFGYNKAKEEMQEQGLALQSDMDKTIEQNIQLKKQIEKMKCCENCKHHCFWVNELNCITLPYDEELKCMYTRKYWEIKEK